jgi:hypothetical protein
MTELERIAYAKTYIEKLANDINPLNDTALSADDIVNDVHISRCLFFTSDILRQVCENGGVGTHRKVSSNVGKLPFEIPEETLKSFVFSDRQISLSEVTKRINALIDVAAMDKLKRTDIQKYLLENGFIKECIDSEGRHTTRPTDKGISEGMSTEWRQDISGSRRYEAVFYNRHMQEVILSHLKEIAAIAKSEESNGRNDNLANEGQHWDYEQEKNLVEMFRDGLTVAEIAKTIKRSVSATRARLVKLKIIDSNGQPL